MSHIQNPKGQLKGKPSYSVIDIPDWDVKFLPTDIANLDMWFHPDSVFSGSGTIDQWNDGSGNGRHASQANATAKPALVTSNGSLAAKSNGVSALTASDFAHSLSTLTVLAVARYADVDKTGSVIAHWDLNSQRSWKLGFNSSNVNARFTAAGTTILKNYHGNTTLANGSLHSICFVYNSGTIDLYLDGVVESLTKTTDTAMTTMHNSTSAISILSELNGAAFSALTVSNAEVHEAMVYSRALSADELAKLFSYTKIKYGV